MQAEKAVKKIELFQRLVFLLMIGIVPLIIDPNTLYSFVDTKFTMIQLLIMLLLISGAVKLMLGGLSPTYSWVSVPLLLLMGVYFAHYFTDPVPEYALVRALKFGSFMLLPLLFASCFKTDKHLSQAEHFLILMTLPMLVYSMAQYLDYELFEYQLESDKSKVQGTLGNSHYLGGYLAIFVFFALNRIRQTRNLTIQVAYLFLFPIILFLLLASRSRGAILCVAAAGFCFAGVRAFLGWRQTRHFLWKTALVGWTILLLMGVGTLWWGGRQPESHIVRRQELRFHRDRSFNNRLVLAVVSIRMWRQNLWWGIGLDRYPIEFFPTLYETASHPDFLMIQQLSLDMESTQANEAHNDFLQTLAETGLVGYGLLTAICCMYLFGLAKLIRQSRIKVKPSDLKLMGILLAALLTVFAQMAYSFPLRLPANSLLVFLVFGWSGIMFRRYGILESPRPGWQRWAVVRFPIALALIAFSVWGIHTTLRQYVGLVYFRLGIVADEEFRNPAGAQKLYEIAHQLYPENGEILFYQGRIHAYTPGGLRQALIKLDEAGRTFSNSSMRIVRSQIYLDLFRYSDALRELEPLSMVTRRLDNLHLARGMVAYYRGDFPGAIEEYMKELEITPNDHQALLYLAQSHFELGNYFSAEQLFLRASRRNIKSIDVQERLGDIYSGPHFMPQRARNHYYQALNWAIEAGQRQTIRRLEKKIGDLEQKIRLKMENPQFRSRVQPSTTSQPVPRPRTSGEE